MMLCAWLVSELHVGIVVTEDAVKLRASQHGKGGHFDLDCGDDLIRRWFDIKDANTRSKGV